MIATLMSHCKIQFEAPTKIGEYSLYTEFGSRASSFNQSFSADLITGLDTNGNSFGIGEFIHPDTLTGAFMIVCRGDPPVIESIQLQCGESPPAHLFSEYVKFVFDRLLSLWPFMEAELMFFIDNQNWDSLYRRAFCFQNYVFFHMSTMDFEMACKSIRERHLGDDYGIEVLRHNRSVIGVNGALKLDLEQRRQCFPPMGVSEFRTRHS